MLRVRVIKKIGLVTRLYFVSARIRRTASVSRESKSITILKPLHIVVAATSWSTRAKRPNGVMSLLKRAISNFPSRCQPFSPANSRGLLSLEYLKKTFHIELEDKSITVKPSCPNTSKRVEWLNMSGLERPRKAFSLARDDLEASIAF
ncbi:MAG: hypothetical protein ACE5EZ_02635 [Thermodesulfobacteriota bacterium]